MLGSLKYALQKTVRNQAQRHISDLSTWMAEEGGLEFNPSLGSIGRETHQKLER